MKQCPVDFYMIFTAWCTLTPPVVWCPGSAEFAFRGDGKKLICDKDTPLGAPLLAIPCAQCWMHGIIGSAIEVVVLEKNMLAFFKRVMSQIGLVNPSHILDI